MLSVTNAAPDDVMQEGNKQHPVWSRQMKFISLVMLPSFSTFLSQFKSGTYIHY